VLREAAAERDDRRILVDERFWRHPAGENVFDQGIGPTHPRRRGPELSMLASIE